MVAPNTVKNLSSAKTRDHQDTCAIKLMAMQQLTAREGLQGVDEKGKQILHTRMNVGREGLLCPKPQRVAFGACSGADVMKPATRLSSHSCSLAEVDAQGEIFDILASKGAFGDSSAILPPHLRGVPPTRASNPLVNDVQFIQKRRLSSTFILAQKPSNGHVFGANLLHRNSSCSASYAANPFVRIEGFTACLDSHRSVPFLA